MVSHKTKYVAGKIRSGDFGSALVAVCFPECVAHSHMAQCFLFGQIRSAGFFYIEDDKVVVYGRSDGLDIGPVNGDENLIAHANGLHPDCI